MRFSPFVSSRPYGLFLFVVGLSFTPIPSDSSLCLSLGPRISFSCLQVLAVLASLDTRTSAFPRFEIYDGKSFGSRLGKVPLSLSNPFRYLPPPPFSARPHSLGVVRHDSPPPILLTSDALPPGCSLFSSSFRIVEECGFVSLFPT